MINESLDFQGMIPGQLTGSCASSDQDLQFESQEHHHGGRGLGMAKNAGDIRNQEIMERWGWMVELNCLLFLCVYS